MREKLDLTVDTLNMLREGMEKGQVLSTYGIKITGFTRFLMFSSLDHLFFITMPEMNF